MWKQFFNVFLLKPYGNNLLAPSAHIWIFFVRLFILGMAIIEALSWGYVGRFLLPNSWATSIFIGSIIFFFVWGMDASLMMLDRNERKLRQTQPSADSSSASSSGIGQEGEAGNNIQDSQGEVGTANQTWQAITKVAGGATTRLVLVVASLVITAPFVALIVFEKDIDAKLAKDLSQKVESQKKAIGARKDLEVKQRTDRLNKLEEEASAFFDLLKQRENELNDELRNKDRPGYGPISKKFEYQVTQARGQLDKKQREISEFKKTMQAITPSEKELDDFVKAVERKDYELLSRQWSINANPNSFGVRNSIIAKDFEPTPEYRKAEFAIQAFLLFIFFGLVVMKIYEPRAIRVYYNAALQSDWERYLAGAYDSHLNTHEVSTASPNSMTPFYFEEFISEILPKLLARTKSEVEAAKKKENLERARKELSELLGQNTGHFQHLTALEEQLAHERAELISCESAIKAATERKSAALTQIIELAKREQGIKEKLDADSTEAQVDVVTRMLQAIHEKRQELDGQKSKATQEEASQSRQKDHIAARRSSLEAQVQLLKRQLEHIATLEADLSRHTADGIRDRMRGAPSGSSDSGSGAA